MNTLLLVEDDKFTRHYFKEQLEPHDFLVLEAVSGKRSLEILQQHAVDVILLDLGLPDGSGLDFIEDIRSYSDAPLIVVSSDEKEDSRIAALDRGADSFLIKPVSIKEMLAHINAGLRRYCALPKKEASNDGKRMMVGQWVLNLNNFQIYDEAGQSGDLTIREFKVLKALVENMGKALSREELAIAATEENYTPSPRTIDVKIARIRKKIGDDIDDRPIIKTVRGVGYMYC